MSFLRRHWVGVLYFVASGTAGGLQILFHHNNFQIFTDEFFNLLLGVNLYAHHPAAHYDVFRYSPTFALLFAPFAVLPMLAGMIAWSIVNAMAVYVAVRLLLPARQANIVLLVLLIEVNNAVQNLQTNALIAGLMVLAFVAYEADRPWRGAMATAAGALIKIFPMAAGLFGLLHARDGAGRRRVLVAAVVVGAIGVLLPLPVTGAHGLLQQYQWWHADELQHLSTTEWSLMAALDAWFGVPKVWWPVQAAGLAVLLATIAARYDAWRDAGFRRLVLCSVLCFVVLFNHAAESPSYVIAMTGVAVWWVTGPRKSYQNVLLLLCFALSSLTHDFVPASWRTEWLNPARARVLPLFAAWIAIEIEMLRWKTAGQPAATSGGAEIREADVAAA